MKQTRLIMGMPITVEVLDKSVTNSAIDSVLDYFKRVDARYSTYKPGSEISQINKGLPRSRWSKEMSQVLDLCEQTKQLTNGYFDISRGNQIDPSGLVKGWSINNASKLLADLGYDNFYIEAGGDIQASGLNKNNKPWKVGLRNPFNRDEIIKTVAVTNLGVATSGTYIRGQHIYNPKSSNKPVDEIVALTVIGPNIYEADRFATAAFAMGESGINFIESLRGHEAYMIDRSGLATMTSGFDRYISQ